MRHAPYMKCKERSNHHSECKRDRDLRKLRANLMSVNTDDAAPDFDPAF